MSGAQGPCAHPAVCTPGRRVGSAALGVYQPWRAFSWATVVTPWLPASPDQQQVSSEGNARPSRSPSEGRASHGKARPGACYKTRPPTGAEHKGAGGHQGAAPRRKRAAWGAEGHWCLGTSGAQPDAALLQLRAQDRVRHGGGYKGRGVSVSQTGGSWGERRTQNPGVNSSRP